MFCMLHFVPRDLQLCVTALGLSPLSAALAAQWRTKGQIPSFVFAL